MRTLTDSSSFVADKQAHLCVVEFVSVTVPGYSDDRNGGYVPAKQATYTQFHVFDDVDELQHWIATRQHDYGFRYMVVSAQRVPVRTTIQLELD